MRSSQLQSSSAQAEAGFDRAFERLQQIVDWPQLDQEYPLRGNAVFIDSVVLRMLLSQRMCPDNTLRRN